MGVVKGYYGGGKGVLWGGKRYYGVVEMDYGGGKGVLWGW